MMTTKINGGRLQLASSVSAVHTLDTRTTDRSQREIQDLVDAGREYNRQNLGRVVGFDARPLVERPGPGKAPTAFRIWKFGENPCDGRTEVFTEQSAKFLLAEQTVRGRLYSFDFDHRSITEGEPAEAGKAAGWHRLEVRADENGKPELWAVDCDWTAEARAGLEATPPQWKYYSPAYSVDPETREILSYTNCALTNNPATHRLPALASAVGKPSSKAGSLALARHRVRELVVRSKRTEKASKRAAAAATGAESASPAELIAALGTLVNSGASEDEKTEALDMLTVYFDTLNANEKTGGASTMSEVRARIASVQARFEKTEAASAARSARIQSGSGLQYGDTADPVAFMIDSVAGCARRNRGESAADIRNGPLPRRPTRPSATIDPVIARIEQAQRNSRGGRR